MIGSQRYPEGHYRPERGSEANWHVWCITGCLEVLGLLEFADWLKVPANGAYIISFGNGSAARIHPGDPLWETLQNIAAGYTVEVFQITLTGGYVTWTGEPGSLGEFDGIRITLKKTASSAA